MKEHEEGYAMPLSAPTFTPPPFESTERSQILLVLYRGDPDAVAWEVPEPLEPFGDGTMLAWVGDMCQPSHTLDLYRECLTAIKVRYGDTIGWYVNFIWVAHDMALLFEREIYGWPANMCDDAKLAFHGSQITGACTRGGEQLLRVSFNATSVAHMGRPEPLENKFGELLDGKFLQVRKFPSPAKDGKPIKQLLDIPTLDYTVHEIHKGNATVEMGHSGLYPTLAGLAPKETVGAWYVRASWYLDYPIVLWDNQG